MAAEHSLRGSRALALLRSSTNQLHEALEARLVIARPDVTAEQYRDYLAALWGWLVPFEGRLWSAPWPPSVQPELRRNKCLWMLEDMVALGMTRPALEVLPRCDTPAPLSSAAERFGVAYVIEGSQLGGQVLLQRIGPAMAPHTPRYLQGYGAETAARWRSFVTALDATLDDAALDVAADTARQTFAGLAEWFAARGVA